MFMFQRKCTRTLPIQYSMWCNGAICVEFTNWTRSHVFCYEQSGKVLSHATILMFQYDMTFYWLIPSPLRCCDNHTCPCLKTCSFKYAAFDLLNPIFIDVENTEYPKKYAHGFVVLCFVVGHAIVHNEFKWSIYPYSSGLLCWHWGNR